MDYKTKGIKKSMNNFEKLINVSDFIKWIIKTYPDWYMDNVRSIVDHVVDMPSAQLEIILCKDCMHSGSYDTDCPIDWNGKEYCSFAERREDAEIH